MAEAKESRDWRIYAELAQRLMRQAHKLYTQQSLGMDLDAAAFALDSTTIDLCLSLFPWAHFRSTKSAVKMHTLLDLRGNIPSFIRVTTGDVHDVNILDEIPLLFGAYCVMDRGYLDFFRLHRIHLFGAFFVTRAKNNLDAAAFTPARWTSRRAFSPISPSRSTVTAAARIIPIICVAFASAIRKPARIWSSSPTSSPCPPPPSALSTKAAGKLNCFQMDQAASAHQGFLWNE